MELEPSRLRASEIARRRGEEERAEALFLGERRRSRRIPSAMREQPSKRPITAAFAQRVILHP
jgi:hypothetical protein